MRTTIRVLTLVLVCGSTTVSLFAQDTSPEAVTLAYAEAFAEGDHLKASTYMHPEALASVKQLLVEISYVDSTAGAMFTGTSDPDSIQARSAEDLFAHFIQIVFALQPDLEETLSSSSVEIIGKVPEGDSLTHVVMRTSGDYQGLDFKTLGISSLKRYDDGWKLLLKEEMEMLLAGLRMSIDEQE